MKLISLAMHLLIAVLFLVDLASGKAKGGGGGSKKKSGGGGGSSCSALQYEPVPCKPNTVVDDCQTFGVWAECCAEYSSVT